MREWKRIESADLAYPAVCLARDGSIVTVRGSEDLRRCNARALWRNHYYRDLHLFDRLATHFVVLEARPRPDLGPVRRGLARLLNRRLRVQLHLREEDDGGVEPAKRMIASWLERDRVLWESRDDLRVWLRRIEEAHTISELADLFD